MAETLFFGLENKVNMTTRSINISLIWSLLLFSLLLGWGCGSSETDEQGEGIVFDTVPVFEKDTFMYPLAMRSSGFMFPEVYFGDIKTIDGDYSTAWQTIPGLITGEYIEFDFDSLYIGGFEILISEELRFARFKNIKVYTEDKLFGIFPTTARIPIGKKVNTLRVELGETDGINRVDIPFQLDSTRNILQESLIAESIYASKSASIFELVFFDDKNKKIPIRSLQVKKARMNFYAVASPQQMNNSRLLFDGRKNFGWRGVKEAEDKTLLFSFEEEQIINGLFFPFVNDLNITKFGFRLRKRNLPEYTVEYKGGNGIFIPLKNTLKGKNFELVILGTKNNEAPFIPELLFHDGSRLFSIYSDSLEFYQKQRLDSSVGNPISEYIDDRVVARSTYKEFAHPLNVIFSKKRTVNDTLPTKAVQTETTYKLCSNGTFLISDIKTEQSLKEPFSTRRFSRTAEGYWMLTSKSPQQTIITCYSDMRERETISRPGKEDVENVKSFSTTFDVTMVLNQVSFSNYFGAMQTGY